MQRVKTKQLIHVQLVISFATFSVTDRTADRVGSGWVGSKKPHKLTGRVGSGNFELRATLLESLNTELTSK